MRLKLLPFMLMLLSSVAFGLLAGYLLAHAFEPDPQPIQQQVSLLCDPVNAHIEVCKLFRQDLQANGTTFPRDAKR